ncbi:MAG: efflux RND transporter periplasmic adaptor subunit [bacterium]|nr:efflux RND transporter periplasmic adaptor subunit [bacterium]
MRNRNPLRVLLPVAAVVLVFVAGYLLGDDADTGGAAIAGGDRAGHAAEPSVWTCSMHPQIQLPGFGQCPICFMDLIPLEADDGDEEGPTTLVMSERAAALAEILTEPASRRSVAAKVRLMGTVAGDETRTRTIAARVPGRIDELFVDFTGATVARGERLVSLYSPALFAAQTELLNALAADRDVARSSSALVRDSSRATVESARRRLRLWGMDEDWIRALEARGEAADHVDIPSPQGGIVVHKNAVEGMYVETGTPLYTVADLSGVWVELEAYESDLAWLGVGQTVVFTVAAVPGENFAGEVVFIDPLLDPRKRTVRVRLEADNTDGRLKPGMFATAVVDAAFGAPDSSDALVIPASAPLITGKRAVIYVRLPGREKPTFEGRVVDLGPRVGDHYVVAAGLAEGELVVVNGNFKIDSALQIQARPSMMNPEGGGPTPGHDHGAPAAPAGGGHEAHGNPVEVFAAPIAFREQLDAVLASYLGAQRALAADDDGAAAGAAAHLAAALGQVDMMLLAGGAHDAWMADLENLRPAADAFESAEGIVARRTALQDLTVHLWTTLDRFGVAWTTVRRFHCPMAFDDQGADWLQLVTETANPYFGDSMLRCGWQIDSLTVAVAEGR